MPRLITLVSWLIAAILCGSIFAANTQPTIQSFNKMPLSFTKNMGQWEDRVLFRTNSGGATMWFTKEGVTYQFTRRIGTRSGAVSAQGVGQNRFGFDTATLDSSFRGNDIEKDSIDQLVLTAKFLNANPNPEFIADGQMEYKCNYFLGNAPSKWHTDVPNYEAITLKDIYPGIDLKYSGDGNGQAAYEFIAAPGADIAQIKVAYEGAEETSIDADGRLMLKTKWGDMTAAIESGANSTGLASPRFALNSDHTLGLAADGQSLAEANSGTLTLSYSTYLGGTSGDFGETITVDVSGNTYVAGYTYSSDFPTLQPYQSTLIGSSVDVFVTKLSSSGDELIYSTYLGGENYDYGSCIVVDKSNNAYVTGNTYSSSFPTHSPFQTHQGGRDGFVTKLNSSGSDLIYSTYIGGGAEDFGNAVAVNSLGEAYVTGETFSSNFPTLNPFQTYQGSVSYSDAFVVKLNSTGNGLVYSTYLGGRNFDEGNGIIVDNYGNACVTGYTSSTNFPTQNPYQRTYRGGLTDVFVANLNSSGSGLNYSTYLGGGQSDEGSDIAIDASGCVYVTGITDSWNFPTQNPIQTYQGATGCYDAFVFKLNVSGDTLIYSTYLGGKGTEWGHGIAVDDSDCAYVTGYTFSSDFPIQNPYQTAIRGDLDAFVTRLSNSGNRLIYSTFLGGEDGDDGHDIAVDGRFSAYITGAVGSSEFPILNPYQTHQGYGDAFVTKLKWTPSYSCGDVNSDEQVDLLDAVFLINYIFVGGSAPQSLALADVDCSGSINIGDAVLLINYVFRHGVAPCTGCE